MADVLLNEKSMGGVGVGARGGGWAVGRGQGAERVGVGVVEASVVEKGKTPRREGRRPAEPVRKKRPRKKRRMLA